MQVETLKDVLKSLHFFQYPENRMAQPDILNKENVYHSNATDNFSYFFYANRTDDKKNTYNHDGDAFLGSAIGN